MDPSSALMFTAYMIPVSLADNILRPVIMARGLSTPMPVILVGVIGGMIALRHNRPLRRAHRSGGALGFDSGVGGSRELNYRLRYRSISPLTGESELFQPRTPAARANCIPGMSVPFPNVRSMGVLSPEIQILSSASISNVPAVSRL